MFHVQKKLLFWKSLIAFAVATNTTLGWDQNDNGLSDVWESRYSAIGLNPEDDEDDDHFSNLQEAILGTDPFNASPYEATTRGNAPGTFSNFLQVDVQQSSSELIWWAVAGKKYIVQSSNDLAKWDDEAYLFANTNVEYSYPITLPSAKKFWRIQVADFDSDQDSLSAYEELFFGTSDDASDSDADYYPDTFEIFNDKNPTDASSTPPVAYTVALDGSGDFTNLKAAIAAIDDDFQVILIKPGVYTGEENTGVHLDETDHNVLILGEQGPASTRIDGAGKHANLSFANASALVGISIVDCVGDTSLALAKNAQTANSLIRHYSSPEPRKNTVEITWNP